MPLSSSFIFISEEPHGAISIAQKIYAAFKQTYNLFDREIREDFFLNFFLV